MTVRVVRTPADCCETSLLRASPSPSPPCLGAGRVLRTAASSATSWSRCVRLRAARRPSSTVHAHPGGGGSDGRPTGRLAFLQRGLARWDPRPQVVEAARERLVKRIDKLLEGTRIELDPARLAQEVACSPTSPTSPRSSRDSQPPRRVRGILRTSGESVGKKLDFMVQELGREVNTLGSKANDAAIAQRVVEMKAELERIREQVQNML